MNLSQEQIKTLIKVGETGDNSDRATNYWKGPGNRSLSLRLIEGKVLVDRWGSVTSKICFSEQQRKVVIDELTRYAKKIGVDDYDGTSLWGADILFFDFIPSNKILMFSSENRLEELMNPITDRDDDSFDDTIDNGRAIAVIPMPTEL